MFQYATEKTAVTPSSPLNLLGHKELTVDCAVAGHDGPPWNSHDEAISSVDLMPLPRSVNHVL
jgi:hypothetical protein